MPFLNEHGFTWRHDGVLLGEQLDDERLHVEEENVALGVRLVSPETINHQRKCANLTKEHPSIPISMARNLVRIPKISPKRIIIVIHL